MKLIDELVGYAKSNAEAAKTEDEKLTWGAHHRNCLAVQTEFERLQALVSALTEAVVIADSYGVHGSDFHTCLVCGAGGAPGIPFKHTDRCAAGQAEETAERWHREQREEMEEYAAGETKLRAGLEAAIRAANLALFVIRKQGLMPNSSWEAGFEKDMATAVDAKAA